MIPIINRLQGGGDTLKLGLTALIASSILLFTGCISEQTTFDPDKKVSKEQPTHANNKVDVRPVFISSNIANVNENQTSAITLVATDDSVPIYSISGGDSASFIVDATAGVVTFIVAPDFETKNIYTFLATATDIFTNTTSMTVTINIINLPDIVPTLANSTASVDENATIGTEFGNVTITNVGDSAITTFTLSNTTNFEVDVTGRIKTKTTLDYETTTKYNLRVYATNGAGNSVSVDLNISINDIAPSIKSAVYNSNATATTADDKLYIYYNHAIDENTISADMSANYVIDGTGAIGSASASSYDDALFHRHAISQDDGSTGSLAILTAGDTNISMAIDTITDMNGEYPTDYNETEIEKFNLLARLKTGQTTSYPNGDATDRDDGHYQSSNARSYSVDSGTGETVIDNATGLIWQKTDDNVVKNWATAKTYCEGITLNGNSDFRLPNIEELMSITDMSCWNPSIYPIFVGTNSSGYWSSTTDASSTSNAWIASFYNGAGNWPTKTGTFFVRCVR